MTPRYKNVTELFKSDEHVAVVRSRILERLRVDKQTGCQIWSGAANHGGYGVVNICGKTFLVHRLMFLLANEGDYSEKHVHHTCYQRACANLAHLQAVTPAENTLDKHSSSIAMRHKMQAQCVHGHPFDVIKNINGRVVRRCSTCIKRNNDFFNSFYRNGPSLK